MSTPQDVSEVSKIIAGHIEEEFVISLEEDGYDNESDLSEAGILDSFGIVSLVVILETQFGIKFQPKDMVSTKLFTVSGLAELVVAKQRDSAAS